MCLYVVWCVNLFNEPLFIKPAVTGLEDPALNVPSRAKSGLCPAEPALPPGKSGIPRGSAAEPTQGSQLQKRGAERAGGNWAGRHSGNRGPAAVRQLELDEDSIFLKYNGIGLGEREVPRGENIAVPN